MLTLAAVIHRPAVAATEDAKHAMRVKDIISQLRRHRANTHSHFALPRYTFVKAACNG